MKSKSQFSFVLIIITALLLGSCSPARSLNVTVTSQVTVTSIKATPEAPSTPTPKSTDVPATPTREASPTPDPRFHELTQEEIDSPETITYMKISGDEKLEYVDRIANDLKIPGGLGAKLSESFTNFGYEEVQLNLIANRNIIPRFALEIDGVRVVVYEVKIQNPDGTAYQGALFISNAGNVPNGTEWREWDSLIRKFQQNSHRELIWRLILEADASNSAAKNPNAPKLTNVEGREETWDLMRTKLKVTDALTSDMSATVWWATSLQ